MYCVFNYMICLGNMCMTIVTINKQCGEPALWSETQYICWSEVPENKCLFRYSTCNGYLLAMGEVHVWEPWVLDTHPRTHTDAHAHAHTRMYIFFLDRSIERGDDCFDEMRQAIFVMQIRIIDKFAVTYLYNKLIYFFDSTSMECNIVYRGSYQT